MLHPPKKLLNNLTNFLTITLLSLSSLCLAGPSVNPTPPSLSAESYILVDFQSEQVLASQNPDMPIDPASLTKMMTVYVVDHELAKGNIQLDDLVTVSEKAWRIQGSRMFIEVGTKVQVNDLIKGIIIQSGNDASIAIAEHIAGTEDEFVSLMNQYAQEIGMKDTHFENATGWPNDNHRTTANDLAKLAKRLILDFPESYKLYAEKWYTYQDIKQPNRNRLLWRSPDVDGIKTGHSSSAGYCLAASSKKDDMRLISIVTGTENDVARTEQSQQLLNYGHRFFETHHLFEPEKSLKSARIWMGTGKTLDLGITDDLYLTIPKGKYNDLEAVIQVDKPLKAPIQKGENHGTLKVKLGEDILAERPLIALAAVEEGNLFSRFSDHVSLLFHKMFSSDEDDNTKG